MDQLNELLESDNKVKTIGVISAENPMGHQRSDQENEQRSEELSDFLRTQQYMHSIVKGEHVSFIVYNVVFEDMETFGKMFDQESFVYAEVNDEQRQPYVSFSCFKKEYPENAKKDRMGKKLKGSQRKYQFQERVNVYKPIDALSANEFTAIGRLF